MEAVADIRMKHAQKFAEQDALHKLATEKVQAEQQKKAEEQGLRYKMSTVNQSVLQLVDRVKKGLSSANDKVQLNPVSDDIAARIHEITGVDVHGFSVAIEARQIEHILKDHGENGASDQSMANPEDIAKVEYALENPDAIRPAGKTQAYVTNKNGRMKPADTVLYEKQNGDGSYYVVQAVPDTKKKTLYVVTAFIGKSGYKNTEAPQSTNANSPGATPAADSAVASNNSISDPAVGVNGEIASSEGQVLRGSDPVQIADVESAGGGKLTVRLTDGSTADIRELSFPNVGEQELWRVLAEYSDHAEGARQLLKEYRAGDLQAFEYAKGVEEGFLYGKLNISDAEMSRRGSYVNLLNPMQKNMAYKYGQYAGEKQAKRQQANIDAVYKQAQSVLQQKGKTQKETYHAVAVDGIRVEDMKPSQKEAFHLAEMIAPGIQANIEVYNGGKEWGYYNPRTDTIRLNINANWNKASMLAFTLGHELAHRAKRGSPAQFKAFADFLVQKYCEQGSSVKDMIAEQLKAAEEHDLNMTEEEAFEEVVADACQKMLLDTNAGQRLAEFGAQSEQNRDFLHRFAEKLREILKKLREIFKNVQPDSLAAQEFARFDANTKQILADMFVDMSIDAGEKLSTIKEAGLTEKITAEDGGVKYKISYEEAIQHLEEGTLNRSDNTHLKLLDETPELYIKKAGAKNRKIIMAWDVAFLAMHKNGEIPGNYHGLGKEIMLRIPAAIENPLYIIKQNNGRIAAITEIVVKGKKPVLVSIELDAYKATKQDGIFEDDNYNLIVTVMDAQPNYLTNTVFSGDVVYNKNNEAPEHFILRLKSLNKALPNDDRTRASSDRSNLASERSAPIAEGYGKSASIGSIRGSEQNVNQKSEEFEKMPFKLPVSKDVSDRELLVDMFAQTVTSSSEYKALENYRKHIQEMQEIEEKLERISAEIRRLSFAEGPRDTETLNRLKLQQKQAVNRLNNYDNILLRLEKSGVLRAMIERSRKQITQESFDRAREYYQERNERREADLRQHYQESRRKAVERHDLAQVRQQIRRTNPGLRVGSQEFCEEAAKLFSQIVRETQVYDSITVKPLMMQSKNTYLKTLTSFMNEPLKGLNQTIRAWARVKHGKTKARQVPITHSLVALAIQHHMQMLLLLVEP